MHFALALEEAIRLSGFRTRVGLGGAALGAVALAGVSWAFLGERSVAGGLLVLAVLLAFGATRASAGMQALRRLRGEEPQHWLPSPSHGVVVLTDTHLLLGGVRPLPLERHGEDRLVSVAYLEEGHRLSVDHYRLVRSQEHGDREIEAREVVTLSPQVTPAAAHAFAKRAREANAR